MSYIVKYVHLSGLTTRTLGLDVGQMVQPMDSRSWFIPRTLSVIKEHTCIRGGIWNKNEIKLFSRCVGGFIQSIPKNWRTAPRVQSPPHTSRVESVVRAMAFRQHFFLDHTPRLCLMTGKAHKAPDHFLQFWLPVGSRNSVMDAMLINHLWHVFAPSATWCKHQDVGGGGGGGVKHAVNLIVFRKVHHNATITLDAA